MKRSHPMGNNSSKEAKRERIDEDHFTGLPALCIRSIFKELDYDTLDMMQQVNRTVGEYVAERKWLLPKKDLYDIKIGQSNCGVFYINGEGIDYEQPKYDMIVKENGEVKKCKGIGFDACLSDQYTIMTEMTDKCPRTTVPSAIFASLRYLLARFSCKRVVFDSVLIDGLFMTEVEQALANIEGISLRFEESVLENKDVAFKQKFLDWIMKMHPKELRLLSTVPLNALEYEWLLAAVGNSCEELEIANSDNDRIVFPNQGESPMVFPGSDFVTLLLPGLVIDPATFAISQNRLGMNRKGEWSMRLTHSVQPVQMAMIYHANYDVVLFPQQVLIRDRVTWFPLATITIRDCTLTVKFEGEAEWC